MRTHMLLKKLIGNTYLFYGAYDNKFRLDDTIYKCIEDPSDGYRSYMSDFIIANDNLGLFDEPIAKIKVSHIPQYGMSEYDGIYVLENIFTNKILLEFGTDNSDTYYPNYIFAAPDFNYKEAREEYLTLVLSNLI